MARFIAHLRGGHAPGGRDLQSALLAAHHILLSHGMVVAAFRDSRHPGQIGITLNLMPTYPASDREAVLRAWRNSGRASHDGVGPASGSAACNWF